MEVEGGSWAGGIVLVGIPLLVGLVLFTKMEDGGIPFAVAFGLIMYGALVIAAVC